MFEYDIENDGIFKNIKIQFDKKLKKHMFLVLSSISDRFHEIM